MFFDHYNFQHYQWFLGLVTTVVCNVMRHINVKKSYVFYEIPFFALYWQFLSTQYERNVRKKKKNTIYVFFMYAIPVFNLRNIDAFDCANMYVASFDGENKKFRIIPFKSSTMTTRYFHIAI